MKKVSFFNKVLLLSAILSFISPSDSYPFTDKEVKSRIIPIYDITVYETYSASDSGSGEWGLNAVGVVAPALRLSEKAYILPMYQGGYQKQFQVVNEDEGYRRYSENQFHNGSVSCYQKLTNYLSGKITGIFRLQLNNETNDEKWGEGLYDYRDIGGSFDLNYKFPQAKEMIGEFFGNFEYYMRIYPNYESLISLTSLMAPETHEKDYNGYQMVYGYRVTAPKFMSEAKYSLLIKYYLDKRVVEDLGILNMDAKRQDYVHMGTLGLTIPVEKNLLLSLTANGIYNMSNQNYYDTRGTTLDWTDDILTNKYYDYYSFGGGPNIVFKVPVPRSKNEYTVSAGYDFTYRRYVERKAQESDSTYTSDREVDMLHTIRASLRYPLTKHLAMVTSGDYTISTSNMDYNRYYRYNYNLLRISCGINMRY